VIPQASFGNAKFDEPVVELRCQFHAHIVRSLRGDIATRLLT